MCSTPTETSNAITINACYKSCHKLATSIFLNDEPKKHMLQYCL